MVDRLKHVVGSWTISVAAILGLETALHQAGLVGVSVADRRAQLAAAAGTAAASVVKKVFCGELGCPHRVGVLAYLIRLASPRAWWSEKTNGARKEDPPR